MSHLARRVASNTIIQLVGKTITTILGLLTVALLTRQLGLDQYGAYTTVFAYVALFAVLADLGFYVIMLRELSQPGADEERIASNVLTLRLILGAAVFLAAFLVALAIPSYPDQIKLGIAIIGLASLLTVANQIYVGIFQVRLRMDRAALGEVVGRVVVLAMLAWLLTTSSSLILVFWIYVLANAANLAMSAWLARSSVRLRPRFDLDLWAAITREALPMGIVLILFVIYFRIDSIMLSLMKSPVDVGIYGAPYKILEILVLVPSIFLGNLFPTLTRYLAEESSKVVAMAQQAFHVLLLAAVPVVLISIILARPILTLVAGSEYVSVSTVSWFGAPATAVTALQLLAVAVGASFLAHLPSYLVVAQGEQRRLVGPHLAFVGINILLNLILIPPLSYVGAAIATLITELLVLIVIGRLAIKVTRLRPHLTLLPRLGLAGLGLGLTAWALAGQPLWLSLPISFGIYLILVWKLGLVPAGLWHGQNVESRTQKSE